MIVETEPMYGTCTFLVIFHVRNRKRLQSLIIIKNQNFSINHLLMQYDVLQRCDVNMWKGRAFLKENIEKKYFAHKINFEFALLLES